MSETSQDIIIQAGSDPRSLPEFSALREEINKINHPARPEMNWRLIESLALTLFRTHGVDLQTVVYYTLARTHKHGLAGFTEGCELLAGVVVNQWDQLWPEQPQARVEILEWFNGRVGSQLRQHQFDNDDMRLAYRAERALQLLCDKLQQVELKRVPRIDNLLYFVQGAVKRLEAAQEAEKQSPSAPLKMPPMIYLSVSEPGSVEATASTTERQSRAEVQPNVQVRFVAPAKKRAPAIWGFGCGVLLCLLIAVGGYFTYLKPLQQQLATFTAKPAGSVLLWQTQPNVGTYGQQLNTLENLSPLVGLQMADATVALARNRWPSDPVQIAESQRWERLLQARIGAGMDNSSYFHLQQQLQALSEKLLVQERTRGSLTISYLKTVVYQMQNELNREIPLEELLRQLALAVDKNQPPSPLLIKQIDDRWNALLSRYHQLTLQAEAVR